ncbi:MAG TPA: hypothetical protein VN939_06375 [Chthoniobacterales bacterium]|jgi:hypothetical protein|nr:hypothetical protein [Chthoniobacterales bacterium]
MASCSGLAYNTDCDRQTEQSKRILISEYDERRPPTKDNDVMVFDSGQGISATAAPETTLSVLQTKEGAV